MTEPELVPPSRQPEGVSLKEILHRLLRRWILIAGIAVGVVVAVMAWTFLTPPRYQSTAVVRILDQRQALGLAQQLSDLPGAGILGLGRDELETEIGVLRSWRLTAAVVDTLALTVRLESPAGIRSRVLEVEGRGPRDSEADITLEHRGGGRYAARVDPDEEPERDLGSLEVGETLSWEGYRLRLAPELRDDPPGEIHVEIVPHYRAVTELREELDIRQQEGGSRLVEVAHTIPDREMAAAIVNELVDNYVAYKGQTERSETRHTIRELQEEVVEYEDRLTEAEERLRRYKEEERIVAPEEQATQQVRRYAELLIRQDALEVERSALARLMALVEGRMTEETGTDDPSAYRQLATFPTLISNEAIQDLLMALLELENERSALLVLRREENRDVRQLTDRIAELESQLHRVGTNYLESLDEQLAAVGEALDGIAEELGELPEQEMEYVRLVRDRTVLNEAYVMLQAQLRLTQVQDAIQDEGVRVVDRGLVAHEDDPEFPKPVVNLLLAGVLGLALGLAAALLRDLWEG